MFDSMARYRFYCAPWLIILITLSMQTISDKFGKHLIIPSNVKDRGHSITNGKV